MKEKEKVMLSLLYREERDECGCARVSTCVLCVIDKCARVCARGSVYGKEYWGGEGGGTLCHQNCFETGV